MTDQIIGYRRTPEGLRVHVSRCRHDYWRALNADDLLALLETYGIDDDPLDTLKSPPEAAHRLMKSWNFVQSVRRWDDELLFHVLMILIETGPVQFPPIPAPPVLALDIDIPRPKRTAAHPRGFLGAKGKKQKPRQLPEIDLRRYLCDPKNTREILRKLKPFWTKALTRLNRAGYEVPGMGTRNPFAFSEEPYLAWHHPQAPGVIRPKLPTAFADNILPMLKGLPWKEVRWYVAQFYNLNLDSDPTLLSACVRFLKDAPLERVPLWLILLAELPPGKRYSFLLALIYREAWDLIPGLYGPKTLLRLCELIPYECLEDRIDYLFYGLNRKMRSSYLEAGFRIANRYLPDYHFYQTLDRENFPLKSMDRIFRYINDHPEISNKYCLQIWSKYAQLENLEKVLHKVPWPELDPSDANEWLRIFLDWVNHDRNLTPRESKRWKFIQDQVISMWAHLGKMDPKYREGFLCRIRPLLANGWSRQVDLEEKFPIAMCLLARLSRKSHLEFPCLTKFIYRFLNLAPQSHWDAFLNAPDSSFLKFEKALDNNNRYKLIHRALPVLLAHAPGLVIETFVNFPGKLIHSLSRLGTLPVPVIRKLVKQFARHQLMRVRLSAISTQRLYALVQKYRGEGMSHPAPKNLQKFLDGNIQLTPGRIERYTEKFKLNMGLFLLDVLEERVWAALKKDYPVSRGQDAWEHGLQFLSLVDSNRRPLKQFLQEYFQGNERYIDQHPRTRQWVKRNRQIPIDLWKRGILFCRQTIKHGPVYLQLERDPAEILKMGTYVGSCLSLGGDYMYSAVAALLDINKQVLYARTADHKVVGRQLLAISQARELVCFDVYPQSAAAEIKNLFFEYDIEFSRALGIDLFEKPSEDDEKTYSIDLILAEDWYDDWPWDKVAYY